MVWSVLTFMLVGSGEASLIIVGIIGGLFLLIIGLAVLWLSNGKTFFFKIFSSKAKGSPIDMGNGPSRGFFEVLFGRLFEELYGGLFGSLFGSREQFNLKLNPTKQTDKMMLELGALISDLQTTGDSGAERWKQ